MIFQYYMTSWVYISTVWCFLGADPEAVKRDVRYNNVAGILNHSYPTVNLLWAREEVLHNKTLPFIQFSISLWNTVQHDTEVSSNFRFMGALILIFFKVLKLEIPVSWPLIHLW